MGSVKIEDYFGSRQAFYSLLSSIERKSLFTEVAASYTEKDRILCPPPDPRCTPDPRGMGVVFMNKMRENADKIAQIDSETGATMTHGEVLKRSIRVAQELERRGITPDDVVSLCTYNHMDSCLPFLASLYLGVKVASLDPTISISDSKYLLSLVSPKIVFCGSESEELIEKALEEAGLEADIVVFGDTEKHIPFSEFLVSSGTEDEFEAKPVADLFDTAVIFFSSGTTGLPKGICTSHYGLLVQNTYLGLDRDVSVILYFTTLYWISGVMLLTLSIIYGGARVLCKKFDEKTIMKHVEQFKVTMTFLAPIYTYKMTQNPEFCNYDSSSLKCVIVGGGPIGEDQILRLRKLLPHTIVCNMYGMTELAGVVTKFNLNTDIDLITDKPLSAGRPVPGFFYKVVDPETEERLGPNKLGEIRLKGKCIMTGYYKKPEESKKAWDKEGYLLTGDIGYYDEDYCFYVVDRIKDLLKYQSWHVPPAEIESVILTHPDAKAAVVIGVPDEIDGDLPMGVVVLKPGATVTEKELEQYVNDQVPDRKKIRAGVKFVDHIPLTPSGKLRRRDVRDWVIKGLV